MHTPVTFTNQKVITYFFQLDHNTNCIMEKGQVMSLVQMEKTENLASRTSIIQEKEQASLMEEIEKATEENMWNSKNISQEDLIETTDKTLDLSRLLPVILNSDNCEEVAKAVKKEKTPKPRIKKYRQVILKLKS